MLRMVLRNQSKHHFRSVQISTRCNQKLTSNVPYQTSLNKQSDGASNSSSLPQEVDAVIVGGGCVGCSVLYHLAKLNGGNVLLVERNRITSGTTWHTSGILFSYRPSESETLMQLQTRDLISKILPDITGEDAGWIKTGAIHIAKNRDQYFDYTQFSSFVKALGVEIIEMKRDEVHDVHPLLNIKDVYGAVYSPGDGTMDPATYCMALVKAAQKNGGNVIENCHVTKVHSEEDDLGYRRVSGIETNLGMIKTKNVINCTGAWAPDLGEMAGVRIPQLTYKHAYVVTESIPGLRGTPMVKDHGTVYLRPQGDALHFGGYEMNPHIVEKLPQDFAFSLYDLDWDVFEPHYHAAVNRFPLIEETGIRSTVCGPESFTPDGKPNIGECPELRGFFVASAFNSGGMMLSGGAGRQLANWVYHGKPEFDLFNCDIRRYQPHISNYHKWLVETSHEKFLKRLSLLYKNDHGMGGRNQRFSPIHQVHKDHGALFGSRNGFERPAYYVIDDRGNADKELDVLPYDYYGFYDNKKHENYRYYDTVTDDCAFDFSPKSHKLIGRECLACRTSSVIFDLSYMAKYRLSGKDVDKAVQLIFTRDLSQTNPGQFVYTLMLNKDGGIEGDVIASKMKENEYYVTAPSSGEQCFLSHLLNVIADHNLVCEVANETELKSILSIQGPDSKKCLESIVDEKLLSQLKYAQWRGAELGGKKAMIGRLSFVGEMGFEIHCDSCDLVDIYNAVSQSAAPYRPLMAGYRAMDSLSLETGFHHWPQSIKLSDSPAEAGLLRFCDDSDKYIGSSALKEERARSLRKRYVYFVVESDLPIEGGESIWKDDVVVGYLRSSDYAYALDTSMGAGYLEKTTATSDLSDEEILKGSYTIERLGKRYPANLHLSSPFDPNFSRLRGLYDEKDQEKLRKLLEAF